MGQSSVHQKDLKHFMKQVRNLSNRLKPQHHQKHSTAFLHKKTSTKFLINESKNSRFFTDSASKSAATSKSIDFANKCYVLEERETNITAYTEFAKFNFQVIFTQKIESFYMTYVL